jgi:small subunit ribosomal protein S6
MVRDYELTFIGKPDLDATNMTALIEKVKGYIAADGGNVVKLDQWGMRRLMYPINKYKEGQYVFAAVQLEPTATAKVENRLKLNEEVIRYLLVRAEDHSKPVAKPAAVATAAPVAEAPAAIEPAPEAPVAVAATE